MKILKIFDFDDTLVVTDAKIKIINKDLILNTFEFANYKKNENDVIDFTDFRNKKLINPQITLCFKNIFLNSLKEKNTDVIILTSRREKYPIKVFLEKYIKKDDLQKIKIIIQKNDKESYIFKYETINKILKNNEYNEIYIYEDNIYTLNNLYNLNKKNIKIFLFKIENRGNKITFFNKKGE